MERCSDLEPANREERMSNGETPAVCCLVICLLGFIRHSVIRHLILRANSSLQAARNGLYSPFRSEFLKLRRWSLGLRRWT
jgi:hypothetical protein